MLPRRLGVRFALEALFLVVLAVAAGLAHLRPLYIVIVMGAAWVLVALAELTAERIDRSPLSYLLPESAPAEDEEEEQERIFRPRPEERTVVAPPPPVEETPEEPEDIPAEGEPEPEPEPAVPDRATVDEDLSSEPESSFDDEASFEPSLRSRLRSRLRRRSSKPEPAPPASPRHVKLLPRRPMSEQSRASKEVAEFFGSEGRDDEGRAEPEETGT